MTTYVYAITRPLPPPAIAGLRGIGGRPVRALPVGDLSCVVSTVDPAEFAEDALEHNLEDLAWLERVAREHDEVVRQVGALTTTAPLRLGTICVDDASAADRVGGLMERASALLSALDGRQEWGVKLFDVAAPAASVPGGAASSGAEYLRRRRAELDDRRQASERAVADAEAVHDRLTALAVRARRHRPQDRQLSGVADPMLLNAAYLVELDRLPEFRAAVAALAAERPDGAVMLTGPWPPYSFATWDES